jgi:uncharacterized protein YdaU (DUF1376 family)
MEIENFILKHFHETGEWLPDRQVRKKLVHSTPAQKKEIDEQVDQFFQAERDEQNKMPKEDVKV